HSQESTHHRHQLYVAKAHPFGATPAQVSGAGAIDERSSERRAQQGIKQGKQANREVGTEGQIHQARQKLRSHVIDWNQQTEDDTQGQAGQSQLIRQQLGFGVGEDEAENQKSEN